jgi:integrase
MQNIIRQRRHLSAEKKYSILEEIKQDSSLKSEILRREGLYSADLQRFEDVARNGAIKALNESRPGRKRKNQKDVSFDEYESLLREIESKNQALVELALEFTVLKKKVNGESSDRFTRIGVRQR